MYERPSIYLVSPCDRYVLYRPGGNRKLVPGTYFIRFDRGEWSLYLEIDNFFFFFSYLGVGASFLPWG